MVISFVFQNLNPHNNKQFWKAMKYLCKQISSIPNLSHNNVVSSMDQEKANMLNDHFSKCFNRSQPSLQTTDCLNYPLADDCPDEILCTEPEVTELLIHLTTGPYLFYLSWTNYWRNMFTALLPSMCPQTHSLPMYSGDSKVGSLP